jgi:diguanylate cyclase (GGDEF)-like protein/PAS domain S-box-containing protein
MFSPPHFGLAPAFADSPAVSPAGATPAPLRVVIDDNYPPYSFRDSAGQLQGIRKEMWNLWQQRTGTAVNLIGVDWGRARTMMESGQADVIDTIFDTPARRAVYDFSAPYAVISVAIYFDHAIGGITDASSLKGYTVGVKDGDACIDFLNTHDITDLKRYASYGALVDAATVQQIHVLCMDTLPAPYFLYKSGVDAQFRQTAPIYAGEFHWAVHQGQTALARNVEKGFDQISPAERAEIESRWMQTKDQSHFWSGATRYGAYLLLGAAALFGTMTLWNYGLRRRVSARTRDLSGALASLQQSEARFRALFELANDAIFILDGAQIVDCNVRAETLCGLPQKNIIGSTLVDFSPTKQFDGNGSERLMRAHIQGAEAGAPTIFEWRVRQPDGVQIDVEFGLSRIDVAGHPRLQAIVRDISDRHQAQAQIQRLVNFDSLTALPNRHLLQERLKEALESCARQRGSGALLLIDLDNFKTLNETEGHETGDALLKALSRRLVCAIDTKDFLARLGGDEFVVLLADLQDSAFEAAAQAEAVALRILESVRDPFLFAALEYHSTASIGLCLFSGAPEETAAEVLKRADTAMYRAKTSGRNTLSFFDPAMQASLALHAALENELRRALPLQQFQLLYQAQVDATNRVIGAEALLRWYHPTQGMISPAQFIPLAEETGLIVPIGQWVLETACLQLKLWSARPGCEQFRIAVNVSARQFRQESFVRSVREVVESTGVEPSHITLELTESLVLDSVSDAIEKMLALKLLGVRFSMDDFGTGYSSLSYLKRLPLDELKIDQSFIRGIPAGAGDEVIVRTIIAMARNLGLVVVAEGVEQAYQRDFLLRYKCDVFQGYLFARPVCAVDFERILGSLLAQDCTV